MTMIISIHIQAATCVLTQTEIYGTSMSDLDCFDLFRGVKFENSTQKPSLLSDFRY